LIDELASAEVSLSCAQVHYTGSLARNGEQFDSSEKRGEPLQFIIGEGRVLPAFEKAVAGLAAGESRQVTLDVNEAYGPADPDLRMTFPADQAPEGLKEGMKVHALSFESYHPFECCCLWD
jgi:FKBP-type peptidyl-prolyl cis-trans isomerase 2